jgi:hypothetical protein
MASRSRRQYARTRRDCRMGLTFTGDEIGRVRAAARRNGMAPAAYAAQAALDRADGRSDAPGPGGGRADPEVLAALMAIVAEMQAAGNNLNQSVRKLNATGQRPGRLAFHAARCMDAIDRASDAIEELRPKRHW